MGRAFYLCDIASHGSLLDFNKVTGTKIDAAPILQTDLLSGKI